MPKNIEIERKFVVNPYHPEWIKIRDWQKWKRLVQSTIHKEDGYKLRIRMIEDLDNGGEMSSFFCFKVNKGKNKKSDPAVRDEYEWPVLPRNALYMMIGHGEVIKIRRSYKHTDGLTYEIDEYQGDNLGVITADVEIEDIDHTFTKPAFLGWEVTADDRLKNSTLQEPENSFVKWKKKERESYEALFVWDGTSNFSQKEQLKKAEPKTFWWRLALAWNVLRGKQDEEDIDTL
jgi:CYTH domain-containing protein